MRSPDAPKIAVVGGGLAGLAAACALTDAGFPVTLFEKRPFLGGRAKLAPGDVFSLIRYDA